MSSPAMRPKRRPSGADGIYSALVPLSSRLDRLMAELAQGFRDQAHYDALESEAQQIADGLRRPFRGKGGA